MGFQLERPKISLSHETKLLSELQLEERYVDGTRFEGGSMPVVGYEKLIFDDVVFKDVSFADQDMSRFEFVDVLFETCDFSNANFQHAVFRRCEMIRSKLTGVNMNDASFGHVRIQESEGRYSSFSFSELKDIVFENCNLPDADFYECVLKRVQFENSTLDNSNFAETDLTGIDLSRAKFDQIEVTLSKLSGCVVSQAQAIEFARLLGLSVKDE